MRVALVAAGLLLAGCSGSSAPAPAASGYLNAKTLASSFANGVESGGVTSARCAPVAGTQYEFTCTATLTDGTHLAPTKVVVQPDGSAWNFVK